MQTLPDTRLRAAGLRVTRPRTSVLHVLAENPHADVDTIATAARRVHPTISPQTVYGVLDALVDGGLVRQIEPAGSPARYELRVGDNHHHLVCRGCGVIVDVDCLPGSAPCLVPAETDGFVVDEAEVVFWGRCSDCLTGLPQTPPAAALPDGARSDGARSDGAPPAEALPGSALPAGARPAGPLQTTTTTQPGTTSSNEGERS